MSQSTACALEGAIPLHGSRDVFPEPRPCALLCADAAEPAAGGAPAPRPAPTPTPTPDSVREKAPGPAPASAPKEDESADPVGDGHSDADLAERLPPR